MPGLQVEGVETLGAHDYYIGGDAEQRYPGFMPTARTPLETDLDRLLAGFRERGRRVLSFGRIGQPGMRSWLFKVMH